MSWLISHALMEGYANSRSSLGLVAAYSVDACSDGALSASSNLNHTPQAYCAPDRMMVFSRLSRFGMTYAPLTENLGAELLTWYRAGFPVRTSVQPEVAQASTAHAADSGAKWHESSVRYDPVSCSWKTHRSLWEEALPWSSVILPRWGMTRNGLVLQHPTLERPISATASGLFPNGETFHHAPTCGGMDGGSNNRKALKARQEMWPTPTVCGNYNRKGLSATSGDGLATAVKLWPTPTASDHTGPGHASQGGLNLRTAVAKFPTPTATQHKGWSKNHNRADTDDRLDYKIEREANQAGTTGQLNPAFVEWLMGWPKNWTALDEKVEAHCGWEQEDMNVPRVAIGVKGRVNRLKAIGNGQVPQCATQAWRILTGIEDAG